MNLSPAKIETTYPLPEFKKSYSDKELREYAKNFLSDDLGENLQENQEVWLTFQLGGNDYAVYNYCGGQWTQISYQTNSEQMGEVIIQNVSVVPKKILISALKDHLGKFKYSEAFDGKESIALTAYRRGIDLHYDIYRITDGVGGSITSYEDNLNCSGKYSGSHDNDEGNNLLLRSLSRDELPYHGFQIRNALIKEAIESLSSMYYIHIHLWYFPEKSLPVSIDAKMRAEYYKHRDYKESKNSKKYQRAWKQLHKALEALILRIIDLQND